MVSIPTVRQSHTIEFTKYIRPAVILFVIAYMILAFTYPSARDFYDWQRSSTGSEKEFIHTLFQLMFGLTTYPLLLIPLIEYIPKLKRLLDKICCKQLVIGSSVLVLISCLVLTVLHVPGWWWTWLTVGVQISILLLAYIVLENRVSPVESVIIGIALMGISIGLWEIPYQVGLKLIHSDCVAYETIRQGITREVVYEIPFILGGILILAMYQGKYKLLNFNRWFWLFILAFIGLYTAWFLTGFWVEMVYNSDLGAFVQNPVDMTSKVIYRASKVALALGLVCLVLRKKEGVNDKCL